MSLQKSPWFVLRVCAVAFAFASGSFLPAHATASSNDSFAKQCAGMTLQDKEAQLASASLQAAADGRPAYCSVRARITTSPTSTINFRVDLPDAPSWNGKLLTVGGGGFDGYISLDGLGFAMWSSFIGYQGPGLGTFVLVSTDSGHQGRGALPFFDMTWALDNPDAMTNHAYRANHLVLWAAVRLAKQVYGREPRERYMVGGSNGGRQGLMAAQHYPEDYQGILSLMPAISQFAVFAGMAGVYQHIYRHPDNWLDASALALFTKAEVEACDELDGLKDGVIDHYKACHFDGASLACPDGRRGESTSCLTAGQIQTIRLVHGYKQPALGFADGMHGYPGYGPAATPSAWSIFFLGTSFEKRDGFLYLLTDQGIKTITQDPNADPMNFDPDKWRDAIDKYSKIMDTTNPDLSAFFAHGGKIILWHGVSDTAVTYERTDEYIDRVGKLLGQEALRKSLRYFVSPALDHYMQGPGANTLPLLAMLESWVEEGKAPDKVIATRLDPAMSPTQLSLAGKVAFTRPLCEHGTYPRYKGRGDDKKASSFVCTAN